MTVRWAKELALGESVNEPKDRIISRLFEKKYRDYYLVCFSLNPVEMLDLFPVRVVAQKEFPGEGLFVLGIAGDRDEAKELAVKLVTDAYQETGEADLRLQRDGIPYEEKDLSGGRSIWQS